MDRLDDIGIDGTFRIDDGNEISGKLMASELNENPINLFKPRLSLRDRSDVKGKREDDVCQINTGTLDSTISNNVVGKKCQEFKYKNGLSKYGKPNILLPSRLSNNTSPLVDGLIFRKSGLVLSTQVIGGNPGRHYEKNSPFFDTTNTQNRPYRDTIKSRKLSKARSYHSNPSLVATTPNDSRFRDPDRNGGNDRHPKPLGTFNGEYYFDPVPTLSTAPNSPTSRGINNYDKPEKIFPLLKNNITNYTNTNNNINSVTVPLLLQNKPRDKFPFTRDTGNDVDDTSSSSSESTIPPAPNGGWGWVAVFASFMVHFITDGVGFAFGVMYVAFLDHFQQSKGKTAFVVSIYYAVPLLAGPLASILVDTYGCRKMTILGGLISFAGFFASVFVNRIEALFVTMGLITGLGLSLVNVASIVIVAFYFESRRAFATGLSTSGSGVGAFALGACIETLIQKYHWRGVTLLISGLFLNIVVLGALMRPVEWPENLAIERRKRKYQAKLDDFQDMVKDQQGAISLLTGDVVNIKNSHTNIYNMSEEDLDKYKAHSTLDIPTFLMRNPILANEAYETLHKDYNIDTLIQLLPMIHPDILNQTKPMLASSPSIKFAGSSGTNNISSQPPKSNIHSQTNHTSHHHSPQELWLQHVDKMRKAERFRFLRVNRSNITSRGCMLNTPKYTLRASSCPDVYTSSLRRGDADYTVAELFSELVDTMKSMCDFTMLKDITYLLFFLSNFLLCLCDDIPHLYIVDQAIYNGISPVKAGFLLSIMGIVNTGGQIFFGYLADKPQFNTIYLYTFATAGGGLSCFAFTLFSDYYSLCILAALYGFLISANYSLTSIILVDLMGLEEFTSSYGLILTAQGIGSLIGPPIGGWVSDITQSYVYTYYMAGALILFSGLIMLVEPIVTKWRKQKRKHASSSPMLPKNLQPIPVYPLIKDYKTNSLLSINHAR